MKKYYLAYGSNLNLEQMKVRCSGAVPVGTTNLKNYRLVYKGSCDEFAYLTLKKAKGELVPVAIYEITEYDEALLDRYEGYPSLYHKKYMLFKINRSLKLGLIYIMNRQFDYHIPSEEYVESCNIGYDDFGFDKTILDEAYNYSVSNRTKQFKKVKRQFKN